MSNEPFQLEQEQAPNKTEAAAAEKIRALQIFGGHETSFDKALRVWRSLDTRKREDLERAFRNLSVARLAIDHVLLLIKTNKSVGYMLGVGTETYSQLTAAKAALTGIAVEEIRDELFPGSAAILRGTHME